jgi:DNA helicase HerA-like ATPase
VGVYFVTQNPVDVPESVLGQLGNRVQHALRAFTPKDQKAVRAAAQTFRANPELDTATVITELGVGEALVSVLEEGGVPSVVERTLLSPPASHMGAITAGERRSIVNTSPLAGRYDNPVDRESAHELLRKRAEKASNQTQGREARAATGAPGNSRSRRQSVGEAFIKSLARTIGNQIGRQLMRGVLGSLKR